MVILIHIPVYANVDLLDAKAGVEIVVIFIQVVHIPVSNAGLLCVTIIMKS